MNEGTRGVWKSKRFAMGSTTLCSDTFVLSSAQILALNATPVTVIGAPLAGIIAIVDRILFQMIPTATQYASGGVVTFQYNGGGVVHTGSIAAAVVNAAAPASYTTLVGVGVTGLAATAITVSNATGAFTTGTGTAKIQIDYRLVTL